VAPASRSPANIALRAALVALALVCAAWLALSLRNERLQTAGIKLFQRPQPDFSLALDDFRRASELSASQQPELFEASVYFAQGQGPKAIAMLRALLAAEPDNRTGWLLLSNWLRPTDPGGADAALARYRALDGLR